MLSHSFVSQLNLTNSMDLTMYRTVNLLHSYSYTQILGVILLCASQALYAAPPQTLAPIGANAPHPKHCLDQRQWLGAENHHPLNLFEGKSELWIPCEYALRDQGYSVTFPLAQPIKMDGFIIRQALTGLVEIKSTSKRAKTKTQEVPRKLIDKMQILFFNSKLSQKYPIYFHEVHFEGQAEVSVRYEEPLDWNPILLRDANFDERRRALKLPAMELTAPIEIDRLGVVFWERSAGEAPTALEQLELTLGGKRIPIDLKKVRDARRTAAQAIEKQYAKALQGFLLIGEERSLVFAKTGTLWAMEGEDEHPKVIGKWRSKSGPFEMVLGTVKSLKSDEKRNRLAYQPLHLIIDEAPDRIIIKDPRLKGDYQVARLKPHPPPKSLLDEPQTTEVVEGKPVKVEDMKPKVEEERAPTFEPDGW